MKHFQSKVVNYALNDKLRLSKRSGTVTNNELKNLKKVQTQNFLTEQQQRIKSAERNYKSTKIAPKAAITNNGNVVNYDQMSVNSRNETKQTITSGY